MDTADLSNLAIIGLALVAAGLVSLFYAAFRGRGLLSFAPALGAFLLGLLLVGTADDKEAPREPESQSIDSVHVHYSSEHPVEELA